MTTTEIAEEFDVTKQAVSKGTVNFLRMVRLESAWGLKSEKARRDVRGLPLKANPHHGGYDPERFNDPADLASYEDHPISSLEPIEAQVTPIEKKRAATWSFCVVWTHLCRALV